jgi:hypothetical protein
MMAGALGPWATWLGSWGSASGLDRGDGWYVLTAAILALALLAVTVGAERLNVGLPPLVKLLAPWGAAALGAFGIAVFLTNWRDFEELKRDNGVIGVLSDLDLINAGWGIYAVGAGSVALLACAAWLAVAGLAHRSHRAASDVADR